MGNQQAISPSTWTNWNIASFSQMTGLSPEQIQQLQIAFNQQAGLTGGRMTINQFRNIYSSIVGPSWNLDADAERIFLMLDTDGNGVLTFDEFLLGYLMLQRNVDPVQRWSFALNSLPVSQPGYLSAQEAQLLLNNMQQLYNFPMQNNYFNTAWSQLGGGVNGYVPASTFIQTVLPLIPQTNIW